ncbi:enoyl-CoA hydratase/isomerase family protein [Aeromonas dhakensis]|uniref:enoyl-CoA hydratase/isomerase family protein n=1 Tax=Aeromonas dhakensis TaxID=196024 RepID=UPI000F52F18E|nr:enoyl-CoA hydratase/isomerase family protein [Aeromonas dhakensis]MDX7695006.1 enoyl-CoA hydratase/isomerase family protein [Aeromonas dhakensis]RQM82694.1 enoyl-CoA hydratase/isomerase family protein [Aeromonas dhakensis]
MSEPVRIETLPTADGRYIGMLTLDSPASLNALSLEMIQLLQAALTRWEQDPAIVCVLLQGAGEKAFCAGGDIRSFYYRKQEASESALFGYARDFFEQEYRLDHHIHCYSKPLICVADGICMGGGIGLFAGAGFRVVTEKSLFAMPEVTIGLYPDVGASWFLSRMPGRLGLWLGLTGARFNGADAIGLGLADHAMASHERMELPARLAALDWSGVADASEQIEGLLAGLQRSLGQTLPAPVLLPHQARIDALLAGRSLQGVLARLEGAELDEPALAQARATCQSGSPISRAILWRQFWQARRQSLAEVFADELTLSVNCVLRGDFVEGVRALLIDKDKSPRWQAPQRGEAWLDAFYRWPEGDNPLRPADAGSHTRNRP